MDKLQIETSKLQLCDECSLWWLELAAELFGRWMCCLCV